MILASQKNTQGFQTGNKIVIFSKTSNGHWEFLDNYLVTTAKKKQCALETLQLVRQ